MPIDGVSSPNTPYTPPADASGSPKGSDPAVAAPPSSAAGALLGHAVGHAAALVLRPAICQGDLK